MTGRDEESLHGDRPGRDRNAVLRLQRAQLRLTAVLRMREEGRACADAVTRLAANTRGLDRVRFVLTATGLKECPARAGGEDSTEAQNLKKFFPSLA